MYFSVSGNAPTQSCEKEKRERAEVQGKTPMEEIERAWFYDDSVTPTKVLVRAEERAVLRKGPRRQKKQREGESDEEEEAPEEAGVEAEPRDAEEEGRPSDSSNHLFWNQDEYLGIPPDDALGDTTPTRTYYEVDRAAVDMMSAAMECYRRAISSDEEGRAIAEEEAVCSSKERWDFVLEAEKAEKSTKELERRLLDYQRNFSATRSACLNLEAALQQLTKENASSEASLRKESRDTSQGIATATGRKADKEATLRHLREESDKEIEEREEAVSGQAERVAREVSLCKDVVSDLERNLRMAQTQRRTLAEETRRLGEECALIEESLVAANRDLKALRQAQRIEETVLKAELEVSNMEDTEINKNVRTTIGEVNEEISTKEKLRLEIWELNRGLDDAARQADALRMDEAKWTRTQARAKDQLESLQPAPDAVTPSKEVESSRTTTLPASADTSQRRKKHRKKKKRIANIG